MSTQMVKGNGALNQTYSLLKSQIQGFTASTDKKLVREAYEQLKQTQGKIQLLVQQNPQTAMQFALALKNIPDLLKRCEQLNPPVQETVSLQENPIQEESTQQTPTVRKASKAFDSKKFHAAAAKKFDTLEKFKPRQIPSVTTIFDLPKNIPAVTETKIEAPKIPQVETEIKIKCQVPSNHALFIRGEGGNLNWEKGIQLQKVDNDTYVYRVEGNPGKITYKILLDDNQWEQGENHTIESGTTEITPKLNIPVVTEIRIKAKVPSGHALFVRGEGANLSWTKGIELKKVEEGVYALYLEGNKDKLVYKVLLDDTQWESGENHVVEPGKAQEVNPNLVMPVKTTRVAVVLNGNIQGKPFIRGNGPGMSWEKGTELKLDNGKWIYQTTEEFKNFEYKILLNDQQWEKGENHKSECGISQDISVYF